MTAKFRAVRGRIQREGLVTHVVAEQLIDMTGELHRLVNGSASCAQADDGHSAQTGGGAMGPQLIKSRDFH